MNKVSLFLILSVLVPTSFIGAQVLPAGNDCWVTDASTTQFELEAFPQGFFGSRGGFPSNARPAEVINVEGIPLAQGVITALCPQNVEFRVTWTDPHGTPVSPNDRHKVNRQVQILIDPIDTVVRRNSGANLGAGAQSVPIELIELSLKSIAPITVTYGASGTAQFDVFISEDPTQNQGSVDLAPNPGNPLVGGINVNNLPVNFIVTFQDRSLVNPQTVPPMPGTISFLNTQGSYIFTPPIVPGIPTMSQWLLILMAILLLSGATILFGSAQMSATGGSGGVLLAGKPRLLEPNVFLKSLATTGIIALGLLTFTPVLKHPTSIDVVGASLSAIALAYLIHLVVLETRHRR